MSGLPKVPLNRKTKSPHLSGPRTRCIHISLLSFVSCQQIRNPPNSKSPFHQQTHLSTNPAHIAPLLPGQIPKSQNRHSIVKYRVFAGSDGDLSERIYLFQSRIFSLSSLAFAAILLRSDQNLRHRRRVLVLDLPAQSVEMKGVSWGLIIGVTIGVVIGALLATAGLLCWRYRKRRRQIGSSSSRRASTIPIRANGVDACTILSDSTVGQESPKAEGEAAAAARGGGGSSSGLALWIEGPKKKNVVSVSGIPKYSYKDLQKATSNFTTVIGQGAFGPVYKAQMSTGETVAVKVLANNSKQGEKEFQTEVLLLGRLHHRNLVNLVGYCAEKGQHMLIYVFMTNGSLASHLYSDKQQPLRWDLRIDIALDVARGLEYLHDGAVPPVIHRDIKSSNILLDRSMKARVADFGLSREEMVNRHASNIRGTYGYLDPEYVSSRSFTKKSDVYSFGVLLFELIAGRNPQQGLMEYVELAAINSEGNTGWEEIVDSRLEGVYNVQDLNDIAALSYKCINRMSRKRPSMRDVVQALSHIIKERHNRRRRSRQLQIPVEDGSAESGHLEFRRSTSEHRREDSMDSLSDLPDVL